MLYCSWLFRTRLWVVWQNVRNAICSNGIRMAMETSRIAGLSMWTGLQESVRYIPTGTASPRLLIDPRCSRRHFFHRHPPSVVFSLKTHTCPPPPSSPSPPCSHHSTLTALSPISARNCKIVEVSAIGSPLARALPFKPLLSPPL